MHFLLKAIRHYSVADPEIGCGGT